MREQGERGRKKRARQTRQKKKSKGKKKARLPLPAVPSSPTPSSGVIRGFSRARDRERGHARAGAGATGGKKRAIGLREGVHSCRSFFFFNFMKNRSPFSRPLKSHLGLVIDRQDDLIDARVLEGLFFRGGGGSEQLRESRAAAEGGVRLFILSFFPLLFSEARAN